MRDKKIQTNKLRISKIVYVFVFFLCFILSAALAYRCLVDYKANGEVTISEFIKNRNIVEDVIMPTRGTIYDIKGNTLAEDVASYTLIAYLDASRSDDEHIRHVVDKEKTAKELSKLINTSYERIVEILNKKAYQVEFGPGGKNLTQMEMEEIKKLNLPGIDFIKSTKRYYPYGDFASYLLGYTKNKEADDGNTYMVGEMGIEGYYNEELTGKSGYITYEKDGRGNIIANSNEYREEAIDGDSIYLTIDSSIQLFIQNEVARIQKNSKSEWVLMAVMDAKTGAILGYSSTPSFDPNVRNLTNYMDPFVSYSYEPGSTMKIFSYMCAINSGRYNGSDTFMSGSKTYVSERDKNDTITIKDWNNKGWGKISYDYGFAQSSNIAVANLLETVITKKELKACYSDYGFGKQIGLPLNNELKGDITFTYDVEAATAGYGQGIKVTPVQMLQGLSIISNDGIMLRPYIVSKIVDSNGKVVLENSRQEVGRVATKETTDKMKELMRSVINSDSRNGTGYPYKIPGYDLIGKTGTASIFEKGKYLTGAGNYIFSFAGIYPGDDPEIIIYTAIKKPQDGYNYIAEPTKDAIINISKYYGVEEKKKVNEIITVGNYDNQLTTNVKKELEHFGIKVTVLGNGNKIINQYPKEGINLGKGDMVVLLTNDYDKKMLDFSGMSYKDVKNILDLMGVDYQLSGYGYAYKQNIAVGDVIKEKVLIEFKELY